MLYKNKSNAFDLFLYKMRFLCLNWKCRTKLDDRVAGRAARRCVPWRNDGAGGALLARGARLTLTVFTWVVFSRSYNIFSCC